MKRNSKIIFDKRGNSKENLNSAIVSNIQFLTAKKLNTSDNKIIKSFWRKNPILVDSENEVYGIRIHFPSRINYFFFSRKLKQENIDSALRKAERQLKEAKEIESAKEKDRTLPKRFRLNNILVDATIKY